MQGADKHCDNQRTRQLARQSAWGKQRATHRFIEREELAELAKSGEAACPDLGLGPGPGWGLDGGRKKSLCEEGPGPGLIAGIQAMYF